MLPLPKDPFLKEVFSSLEIPLEETKEISEEEQEIIYATAFDLYATGKYRDSESLFTKLAISNPYDARFWRGLASSRQMLQKYTLSLHAWCLVAIFDDQDPYPHFHAAECLISLGEGSEAIKALLQAETLSDGKDLALSARIHALKQVHGEKAHG